MIGNVVGNYRIEREIGEGGMSHVYVGRTLARSEILPENYAVVLKVMSEELAGEVTARKRFVKEAQILSKLRHRYITRFFEFINNNDGAVLVMEFVEGLPVDVLLSERGALPVVEAIAICQCLLEALVYAHGKGIVHRDIKPANLIREKSGSVKVTDFGIAKIKEGGAGPGAPLLDLGDAEVGDLHRAALLADQVGRLDVAVNDALAVRVDERLEQALADGDGLDHRQRPALAEEDVDGQSLDELHHQHRAVVVVDELEETGDVAVAELGEDLGLFDEALPRRHLAGQLLRHDFEDDRVVLRKD